MIGVGFLILSLIIAALVRVSFFSLLEPLTYFFHSHCVERVIATSSAASELKALICGESISAQADSQIYIANGLIHVFVCSVAHLIFLERLLIPMMPTAKKWTTLFRGSSAI